MIKRNIIFISSLLFILNSCDNDDIPMYFRSMQPSGGKLFKGSAKEYFINSLPKKMYIGSKDLIFDSSYSEGQQEVEFIKYVNKIGLKGSGFYMISVGALMLPLLQGADFGVQIIRNSNQVKMNIHFDENKTITESLELDSLFPDSMFSTKGIALSKENIISFNKENDNGNYHIEEVWEIDRSHGTINIYEKPFHAGMPGNRVNIFDNTIISNTPLESFDKLLGNMKKSFNLDIVDFNDSLKTYSADPNYMSFRYALHQDSYNFSNKLLFVTAVYYACLGRIESDSVKYEALLDYLDPYIKSM